MCVCVFFFKFTLRDGLSTCWAAEQKVNRHGMCVGERVPRAELFEHIVQHPIKDYNFACCFLCVWNKVSCINL